MEDHDLGQASRLAAATRAYVCFEGEAGQNLSPPKARTWAPRSHTLGEGVRQGSGRVSVAGLVCYKPGERSRLCYKVRTHRGRKGERRSMSEADYASLLTAAAQHLSGPVILVWDYLNTHVSAAMRAFIDAHPDWLTEVRLPRLRPDLNAVEGAWANMKGGLGKLSATDVDQLTAIIKNRLKRIQHPAGPHRRVPRPDRVHYRTRTVVDLNLSIAGNSRRQRRG